MTRIPVDLTAPIVCTASSGEIGDRIDQIGLLRDQLVSIERTPAGLLLAFDATPAIEADLERFVRAEKGCCQFWGFEIDADGHSVTLCWDGPPDVQGLMDELHRYFVSDEPLDAFAGLL